MVAKNNYQVIWSPEALEELVEILTYLDLHSAQATRIVKEEILAQIQLLSKNPALGSVDRLKTPNNKSYRAIVVFSYRISYVIKDVQWEIHILRIRHTGREPLYH